MADVQENTSVGQMSGTAYPNDSGLTDQYEDFFQIATDRLLGVVGRLVEAVCSNPVPAAGLLAVGVGAAVGLTLARQPRSRKERLAKALEGKAKQVEEQARRAREGSQPLKRAADYGEVLRLGVKLLENPIVRGLIVQALTKRVAKRFK